MHDAYQFAGITGVTKLGKYDVKESARVVSRLAYAYNRLMRVGASHLPLRVNWHFKAGLARHLYEDSQAVTLLMKRASELRLPQTSKLKAPDPWLEVFFDELLMAETDRELWVGIYEIVRPELKRILDSYVASTQPLVDYPTVRLMKQLLLDLDEQLRWGEAIQPVLLEDSNFFATNPVPGAAVDSPESVMAYRDTLTGLLETIGGLDGSRMADVRDVPNRRRSKRPFQVATKAVRDPRMGGETLGRTGVSNPPEEPQMAWVVASARTRQEELGAAELCATTLVLQENMPWSFYEDMARHCWDEMRHTLFGQAVLDLGGYDWFSMPQFKGDYDPHMKKPVANAYVWLSIGIEGSAMKKDAMPREAKNLKEIAEQTKDPVVSLFAQCVDFDWADEVTHHQFGRKWAEDLIGDYHTSERIAQHEMRLNLIRMARDTNAYWETQPDSVNKRMHLKDWENFATPDMLAELERKEAL